MILVHFAPAGAPASQGPTEVRTKTGRSLMEAATDADVDGIAADCGGLMTCATCHVYVREPWLDKLPAADPQELAMLEFTGSPRRPNSRLSCQIFLSDALDGLTVDLPDSQY